jgi:hypothetical protein
MVLLHENLATDVVNKLANQPDLVGIMIDIEDYLDNNSLYVFDNWIKGVLVAGPIVKKYWVEVAFKYDLHDMPDPEGALRLTPHGTKVSFKKAEELVPVEIKTPDDYEPGTHKPRMKKKKVWLVYMRIPRRFVEAVNQEMLDQYDDEADDTDAAADQLSKGTTL